ncbi:MAG: glycosyltransferase family 39 protein, partial [Ktedonobacteraceae bacterium]|nr:glycosyltransferase family 39 protein [Ktedonobacteraceae bacterium]
QTTEFDPDQAILFRMAYDAVHYGLLPVTSNIASIGISHPPGVIYLYMIPALFSANPLGGALLVSAFSTISVLLTYFFCRRYFGRANGLIAALLFATAVTPLNYSRFIWQPNLMSPFVVLYLFVLFRGVHDRRPGWLMLALPLLGLLYQAHPTGGLLAILLVVALVLAPGTVRWYDWGVALIILSIIFLPYIFYLVTTHFADLQTLLILSRRPAHIDRQAFTIYWNFISPFGDKPPYPGSILSFLAAGLSWLKFISLALVVAGALLVGKTILGDYRPARTETGDERSGKLASLLQTWRSFRADPVRCSMALLLIWQVIPLLALSRHQVNLHAQYLFIFLPGPFILSALFLTWLAGWVRLHVLWPGRRILATGIPVFVTLLIIAQLAGGTALVLDQSYGNYTDNAFRPYHNSLASIQQALARTEQVAEQQHVQRIYITSDSATDESLRFLVSQMRHPVALFDTPNCFVLPAPSAGPAVVLTNPYNPLTDKILQRFTTAKLVTTLPRLGGAPYKLYIVSANPLPSTSQVVFPQQLSLTDPHGETLIASGNTWLVSRWLMQHTAQQAFRTSYSYSLTASSGEKHLSNTCHMNTMQAGDQLLMAWSLPQSPLPSTTLNIQGSYGVTTPSFFTKGPLRFDTYHYQTHTQPLISTTKDITLSTGG